MTILEAMEARHSVRAYTDRPIEPEILEKLNAELAACNEAGGLQMRLVAEEPKAFSSFLAKYGKFSGVRNYVAVAGKPADDLYERAGYFGESICAVARFEQLLGGAHLQKERGKAVCKDTERGKARLRDRARLRRDAGRAA